MLHDDRGSKLFGIQIRNIDVVFFACCFIFLYFHVFLLPNIPIYYEMDHVALLNDAKRMVEGEVIYRDFFELTFPGSHTLYFIFFSIFGTKYWVSSLLIMLHGMASAAISLFISKRIIADNIYAYLPPALYIFVGFRWLGIDGEHRMFSPVFAILAVLFLLDKRTYGRIAAAGTCCAVSSFFTQQRGVLAAIAIGIFLFIEIGLRKRDWEIFFKSVLILGVSFSGSLALLLLPFIITVGADRFYESTFLFLSSYVQDPTENSLRTYLVTLSKIQSFGVLMTLVAVFYYALVPAIYVVTLVFLWFKRNDSLILHKKTVLLVALLGILLAVGTLAPSPSRIYQIALPALIVLAWFVYNLKFRFNGFVKAVVVFCMAFGLVLAFRLQTVWDATILPTPSGQIAFTSPVILERYQWLSENAIPGDLVYETYNSHVNFPLNLSNPSAISVLLNSGYTPPEQVARAIEDLKATKARYIIWDAAWTNEMEHLGPDEKLKPFYIFLKVNYQLRQKFTPYDGREREIWERIDKNPR